MANPDWTFDEHVLALDLYFKVRNEISSLSKNDPRLLELSGILKNFPIHPKEQRGADFRNPNGVYMKLCNFLSRDPAYTTAGKVGLARGAKGELDVWNRFSNDHAKLQNLAEAIKDNLGELDKNFNSQLEDDEPDVDESAILYRVHRIRERNSEIIRKKKLRAIERFGKLECEVCGFDFEKKYGKLGHAFIECHHSIPVSELAHNQKTKIQDLHLVCSNCHRMLHRSGKVLSIDELKSIVNSL